MMNGEVIRIVGGRISLYEKQENLRRAVVETDRHQRIAELDRLEQIKGVVQSDEHTVLLVLLRRETRSELEERSVRVFYEYAGLGLISLDEDPKGKSWTLTRLLKPGDRWQADLKREVVELGAVDKTGRKCLVKIAEYDPIDKYKMVRYIWQTWDMKKQVMVSEGLHPFK